MNDSTRISSCALQNGGWSWPGEKEKSQSLRPERISQASTLLHELNTVIHKSKSCFLGRRRRTIHHFFGLFQWLITLNVTKPCHNIFTFKSQPVVVVRLVVVRLLSLMEAAIFFL